MRISIRTQVEGNYQEVIRQFERPLFEALAPKAARLEIIRFDGSKPGDVVHVMLKPLGLFALEWISEITDAGDDGKSAWFTDKGKKLPFFLSYWEHKHVVEKDGDNSVIVDDIEFKSPFGWLIYPGIYQGFAARKPIYKKFFAKRLSR